MNEGYNITFYTEDEHSHLVFTEQADAAFVVELLKNFYDGRLGDTTIPNSKLLNLIRLLEYKHNISKELSDSLPSLEHEYPEELIYDLLGIIGVPCSIRNKSYWPAIKGLEVYFIEDLVDITDSFSFTKFDI